MGEAARKEILIPYNYTPRDYQVEGFEAINREKKKQNSSLPYMGIVTVVNNINYLHLDELTKAAKDFDLAWHIINLGTYTNDSIVATHKKFMKENPDDIPIYYNLAMLYGKINMPGESHYNFGIFFKKKHKLKSALFHFKAAQNFFPPDSEMAGKISEEIDSIGKHPAKDGDEHAED